MRVLAVFLCVCELAHSLDAAEIHRFERLVLSEEFRSEGAAFADFDADGDNDIVSGSVWYEGPEFRIRHEYMPGQTYPVTGYSAHFFSWTHDFNGDQRPDILVVGFPGQAARWFENPGVKDKHWMAHEALSEVGDESPDFADINGEGFPELVCVHGGQFGYAAPNRKEPGAAWSFMPVTPKGNYGAFTHGLGLGDVNSDGRLDLLETNGWWQQPPAADELFAFRPSRFAQGGGADMFAYDFDGDGDNDVVSSQNAHGFGLTWFENRGDGTAWIPHAIMTQQPSDNAYGLAVSQLHALALADINGDGLQDIVTGKRFYAHAAGDPGVSELPVLYWFQTVRGANGVEFIPHLIDERSGVGTQLTVGDVTGDGLVDILVGNKLGTFLFVHRVKSVGDEQYLASLPKPQKTARHLPGTSDFASGVRSTDALTPDAEKRTFILPQGFEAQLVAAEPDIQKPLNLAFDARGRLLASMSLEYPYAAPLDKDGRDVIKVLEDTDGDGRADRITTFADKLNIPIGLYPYQDGVICYSIPNIWFLRDTDGDGQCDKREVLYGPMGWERDTHGMCNAFRRGFDGWMYSCHGFNNQTTVAGRDGHTVTMQSGNTFRFRMDGSRVEHFTRGQVNPFGMCFDPFGNLFTADCHTKPVTLLLSGGYYESFGKPHDGLGFVPNVMDHLHGSTAIAGIAQVNSDCFPAIYRGNTFGGNVMTSRINRNSLVVSGSSVRAQEEPDFLIAGDSWFRPVDLVFSPDGALYVADFYNKIIGHYEVPLTHPERDRFRGRIWKIVYRGDENRRDVPAGFTGQRSLRPLEQLSPSELIAEFATDDLNRRMLIADRLVDGSGDDAIVPAHDGFAKSTHPLVRLHCLWVLQRLNALRDDELARAFSDADPLVRTHACRVLETRLHSSSPQNSPGTAASAQLLLKAFEDAHPQVRRAAVMASMQSPSFEFVRPLIDLFARTPPDDVHLRHAVRMALREQLRADDSFAKLNSSPISDAEAELIAGICLGLKTPASGDFLLRHLSKVTISDRARLVELVKAAAQQVSPENVGDIASLAQKRFAGDRNLQIELLNSVRQGLGQRGTEPPPVVREWAHSLATQLLRVGPHAKPAWTFSPLDGPKATANPWGTQRRPASDGEPASLLISSHPHGERLMGRLTSRPFVIPKQLSFFIAGHSGLPETPALLDNVIRLRLLSDDCVVTEALPPRNDTAQRVEWKLEKVEGQSGYLELVDALAFDGFAWLAVGRFSLSELNPSDDTASIGEPEPDALAWTYSPVAGKRNQGNPWVLQLRPSADGLAAAPFFSSLPLGEQRTGIYRSEPFELGPSFSFFAAGHIGPPNEPVKAENFIRLRDASTNQVLFEATPPRNDTAQKIEWKTASHQGKQVYVELIDGDTRGAFAWMAVGRFSVPGLNPSRRPEEYRQAAGLASAFRLKELIPALEEVLLRSINDRETAVAVGEALVELKFSPAELALVEAFRVVGTTSKSRLQAAEVLVHPAPGGYEMVLVETLKVATSAEQLRIADRLASDAAGVQAILSLAEQGKLMPALIAQPSVQSKLAAFQQPKLRERIDAIVASLPPEDAKVELLLVQKKNEFSSTSGKPESGAVVFKKVCVACHKVADQGNTVGPNLDGIGNRGVERLLEDLLAPNRNVDVAFRTTTIVTKQGRVLSGLIKPSEGQELILIDNQGKPQNVPLADIDERIPSKLSLMPANLTEQLKPEELQDLVAYLLTLRQN